MIREDMQGIILGAIGALLWTVLGFLNKRAR